jgi:steroid delta-isomerase-like uncharacterized protein
MPMSQENEDVVRRFYREVLGQGRIDVSDELFTTDYVEHQDLDTDRPGLAGAKAWFQAIEAAFPNRIVVLEDLIVEADQVVARWSLRATHTRALMGIPPTGRTVEMSATTVFRLANRRIVEGWHVADSEALIQQLNVQSGAESEAGQSLSDADLATCGAY